MKELYTLTTRYMNGTVTMSINTDNFATEELAKKVKKVLDEQNSGHVITKLSKTMLYENEDEVPILKSLNDNETNSKEV